MAHSIESACITGIARSARNPRIGRIATRGAACGSTLMVHLPLARLNVAYLQSIQHTRPGPPKRTRFRSAPLNPRRARFRDHAMRETQRLDHRPGEHERTGIVHPGAPVKAVERICEWKPAFHGASVFATHALEEHELAAAIAMECLHGCLRVGKAVPDQARLRAVTN